MKGVTIPFEDLYMFDLISIHTPVKGVTRLVDPYADQCPISIHTPVKGVTIYSCIHARWNLFQSTHP